MVWLTDKIVQIPENFPSKVRLIQQDYKNWARAIHVNDLWTAIPVTPQEVVVLANWAVKNDYTLRPRGYMHNWSPIVVTPEQSSRDKVVLIDTTQYLTNIKMVSISSPAAVQVQTGASLEGLLDFLEINGFGIASHPATGQISIGGIIAINGHGAGIPSHGQPNGCYGTISNLIISLNAVVWNETDQAFEIKKFDRRDPETKALLTSLGRIFITEVTLRVTPKFNVRCISRFDIPASELFADPLRNVSGSQTFAKFLETYGNIEVLWFPFTSIPWIKTWEIRPTKPLLSRKVNSPYNFPFSDSYPEKMSDLVRKWLTGNWNSWTPYFGKLGYMTAVVAANTDLWGSSKDLLLYVKTTTLRLTELGYVVITNRENIQLVVSQFVQFYNNLIHEYASQKKFPINAPLEIRVTGLDHTQTLGISNAEPPTLSVLKPIEGRPDLDTAVWFCSLSIPNTPNANNFMMTLENFLLTNYPPSLAIVRPEWSKGWAYTESSGWSDKGIISTTIPNLYNIGAQDNNWDFAISVFNKYDPKRVFTNPFHETLLR